MRLGKPQGIAMMVLGLVLLTGGILVFAAVPSWGDWVAGYPNQVAQMQLPAQAAPVGQGIGAVFGPLLRQVGGYVRSAGYFGGSLLTVMALAVTPAGAMVTRGARSA